MNQLSIGDRVQNWGEILQTQNLSASRQMDQVSRWLLITRASVFPMTLISGLIGGLLAVGAPDARFGYFVLAIFGLLVAHAANNMINDYFDLDAGVDTEGYVRTIYAPHPILSGLISKSGLLAAIAVLNAIDLLVLLYLAQARGPITVVFAVSGLFISVFYVAPPLRLKHHGFGEPGVAIVWGPLMIGGTYFVTTGALPFWVTLAGLPYALLVTSVLFGKHIDKLPADRRKGIHTLPVIIGEEGSRIATRMMMVAYYVGVVSLVAVGVFGVWCLLVLASLPRLVETLRVFRAPRPSTAPKGYPIWPLWYVAWAFRHTRRAGGLLVLGLVLNALFPWFL